MSEVASYAAERWPAWFGRDAGRGIEPVALAGGPAHRRRAIVFLLSMGERRPAAALKIAFTPQEEEYLEAEFWALKEVWPKVPAGMRATVPEALGLDRVDGRLVLATQVLEGRRLLVPHITGRASIRARRLVRGFLAGAFSWSDELARATGQATEPGEADETVLQQMVEEFLAVHPVDDGAQRDFRAFGRALGRERIRWTPSWQHRDVAVGNVLMHRGALRFLDWEHASALSEPWFDIGYAPGALTLLAQRQSAFPSVRDAGLSVLGMDAWAGRILREEMERAWRHPLPLAWAVALVVMSTAVRRRRHGRGGWTSWGELALGLVADREFRRAAAWLAPEW
ncbi:MAG: hypothetical protein ACRDJS_03490 [Actinomycetota bacterium]